jgi:hypothetical protein
MRRKVAALSILLLVTFILISSATNPTSTPSPAPDFSFNGRVALARRTLHSVVQDPPGPHSLDSPRIQPISAFLSCFQRTDPHILPFTFINSAPPSSSSDDDDSLFQLGLTFSSAGIFVASQNSSVKPAAYDQLINKFSSDMMTFDEGGDQEEDYFFNSDIHVFGGYLPQIAISNFSATDAEAGFIQSQCSVYCDERR